jgi:hypothetical protein
MANRRADLTPPSQRSELPETSGGASDANDPERMTAEIGWGALLLLARLSRTRLAERCIDADEKLEEGLGARLASASPEDAWRMAVSQVCRRRGQTRGFYEALAEQRLDAYARLRTIGYCFNIPYSSSATPARLVAEFNECLAEMSLELQVASGYLPSTTVHTINQLIAFVPPLGRSSLTAELASILSAYDNSLFDQAFESFVISA